MAGVVCLLVYGSDGLQLVDTLEEEKNLADEAHMAAQFSCWVVERGGGGKKNVWLKRRPVGWTWQHIRHAVGVSV